MFMAFEGFNNLKTSNNTPLKAAFSAFVATSVETSECIGFSAIERYLALARGLSWLSTQTKTPPALQRYRWGFGEMND